ncbi:MAG: hypothetical protein WKG06_39680 [Segetibacter sp.]
MMEPLNLNWISLRNLEKNKKEKDDQEKKNEEKNDKEISGGKSKN